LIHLLLNFLTRASNKMSHVSRPEVRGKNRSFSGLPKGEQQHTSVVGPDTGSVVPSTEQVKALLELKKSSPDDFVKLVESAKSTQCKINGGTDGRSSISSVFSNKKAESHNETVATNQEAESVKKAAGSRDADIAEIEYNSDVESADERGAESQSYSSDMETCQDSYDDGESYTEVRNKRKRRREQTGSPEQANQQKKKVQQPLSGKTMHTVYMKGNGYNLAKSLELRNIRSFKNEINTIIGVPEEISCRGDSVRIVCQTKEDTKILMSQTVINDRQIICSLPWSIQKRDKLLKKEHSKTWEKGVITKVSLEITTEDVKAETGAIWAHRITKRTVSGFEPTMAVIIAYEDTLPKYVNVGFLRHKVSVYIPAPTRCNKCQRFGHKTDQCSRKEPRCSRCSQAHEFEACSMANNEAKCANCGGNHSSAYKGCQKYQEISNTLKTAAVHKMTYRDALKQVRASNGQTQQSVPNVTIVGTNVLEKKSVETQTVKEVGIQTGDACNTQLNNEQMLTLLKTTATAMLWLVQTMQPSTQQTQVLEQLSAVLKVIGVNHQRRNSEPLTAAGARVLGVSDKSTGAN